MPTSTICVRCSGLWRVSRAAVMIASCLRFRCCSALILGFAAKYSVTHRCCRSCCATHFASRLPLMLQTCCCSPSRTSLPRCLYLRSSSARAASRRCHIVLLCCRAHFALASLRCSHTFLMPPLIAACTSVSISSVALLFISHSTLISCRQPFVRHPSAAHSGPVCERIMSRMFHMRVRWSASA